MILISFASSLEVVKKFRQIAELNAMNIVFACPEDKLFTYEDGKQKYQIIHLRDYTSAEDVMADFDFTVTCQVTDGINLWQHKDAVDHINRRQLVINVITAPVSFLKRIGKYSTYGYTLYGEQAEIAVKAIRDLPPDFNNTRYVD